jgi:pyruvate,water dikinase
MLRDKLAAEYPNLPMRFRSSSTAEDLEGFAGAGLYTSKTGDLNDPKKPPLRAIKKVWSSVWYFRGYEERDYRSVDQKAVGMAVLAHPSFPMEEASGIAVTANPFDPTGLQPGFFINVQPGDESVTLPQAGVKADQFIYHFKIPGQPMVYLEHSSLVPAGETVLTPRQVFDLGMALDKIHEYFRPAYGPSSSQPGAWYGLEVDFKFDGLPGQEPALFIKQARPHPGRGGGEEDAADSVPSPEPSPRRW